MLGNNSVLEVKTPFEGMAALHLGENIVSLRKARGVTQAGLSQLSGIPRSTVAHFESGSGNPSLNNLVRLGKALEVRLEELLAPPVTTVRLVRAHELEGKQKNGCQVYSLLPKPVKGLGLERFELDPGQGFQGVPHLKGTMEYFACVQGRCEIQVVGKTFLVTKGDVLVFSGDERHSYLNVGSTQAIAISVLVQKSYSE